MIKRVYVGGVRAARAAARPLGILSLLENRKGRVARWLRSLFAIYDIEDMIRLDLPWWTFEAIAIVDRHLARTPGARVFEWGSGASTSWLARRAREVHFVEHEAPWFDVVRQSLRELPHALGVLREPEDDEPDSQYHSEKPRFVGKGFRRYVEAIDEVPGSFDVIVVDGRCRARCLERAIPRLAPGGIIVFDNSHRRRYRAAISSSNLSTIRTRGLTACLPYPDETTILGSSATIAALTAAESEIAQQAPEPS